MPRTARKDPNLKPGKPTKPQKLSARASAEWDRLCAELEEARIHLSAAHRATLTLAATMAADITEAWETVKRGGEYFENKKTGAMQLHPAAKRLDALRRDYLKALTALGLRAVVAQPEETPMETLEDILNG